MWQYNDYIELYHHGVIGMKWGVRRYQNKNGSHTRAGKEHQKKDNKVYSKDPESFVKSQWNKTVGQCKAGMSDEAFMTTSYILGIAAYFGAMYGVNKLSEKSHRKKKAEELEQLNSDKQIKSLKEAPRLSKPSSPSESIRVTNPDYPGSGTTMNCTFCTTAMALREKGYSVKASKTDSGFYTDELFGKTFNSSTVKMKKQKNGNDVLNELSKNGDGTYGNLTVSWKLGGAHSVFWKNEGGKAHIYDGQSGKEITSSAYSKNTFLNNIKLNNITYNRLDNCEPTEYALAVVEKSGK